MGAGTTPYINSYDSLDRVLTQTHGNSLIQFTYTVDLTETDVTRTVRDANGQNPYTVNTHFWYDSYRRVSKIRDGMKNEIEQLRDALGFLQEKKVWQNTGTVPNPVLTLQKSTQYIHDADGRRTQEQVTLDTGEVVTRNWTYDYGWLASEQVVSSADPGKVFRTEYTFYRDANNEPTNIHEAKRLKDDGVTFQTTTYTYDGKNRLASEVLPDNQKIVYLYENNSLYATRRYFEIGGVESAYAREIYGYDTQGNRNQITDGRGNLTQTEYDDLGRITVRTNALNQESHLTYVNNNLTQLEVGRTTADGEGQVIRLTYNAENRLVMVERKDDAGTFIEYASYTYDSDGNRLSSTDGAQRTTNYSYDQNGRLKTIKDPLLKETTYGYDASGNRIKVTDGLLRDTLYDFDDLDRLIEVEQTGVSPALITLFGYDANGNLISVQDPKTQTTTYSYDTLSRLTGVKQPLLQEVQYFYDDRDRVDYTINARGNKIDYTYKEWGSIDSVRYYPTDTATTPNKTVIYGYDFSGNITGVSDDSIQAGNLYTFTYDELNRPDVTTTGYITGLPVVLDNDYDRFGNRSVLTVNDGVVNTHQYNYNKLNRLETAVMPGSQTIALSYYGNDDLQQISYPHNTSSNYTYYGNGPVQDITVLFNTSTVEQFAYTYDDAYNVDTLTDADGLHDYGYDGINRLTSAVHPAASSLPSPESYTYDNAGNREDPVDSQLYDYDANNRITQSPGVIYTFDDDGNMLTKSDGAIFTYDYDSRLVQFTKSADNATYQYDPFGRRVSKTVNGVKTWYVWDRSYLQSEYDNTNTRIKRYAYIPFVSAPIQLEDVNGIYNVLVDSLDTPRLIMNITGNTLNKSLVWKMRSESFGESYVEDLVSGQTQPVVFNIRFPGQYYDQETGLHYNFLRSYDPKIGRFYSIDPAGVTKILIRSELLNIPPILNSYIYANDNPQKYIDTNGDLIGVIALASVVAVSAGITYLTVKCLSDCKKQSGGANSCDSGNGESVIGMVNACSQRCIPFLGFLGYNTPKSIGLTAGKKIGEAVGDSK